MSDTPSNDTKGNRESFTWRWRDPSHLEAHRAEFYLRPEEVLEELRPIVARMRPALPDGSDAPFHADFELAEVVGESGLKEVNPGGSDSFWAYRLGRSIPSHLCFGTREPTKSVCLWGTWEEDVFVIHTLYPGRRAPREIHDPEIALNDLSHAIEFWRLHAIITKEGSYSLTPNRV
ncbi:MAG: hypothetical protein ACLFNT_09650 [Spirochaetales bacterium]